MDDTLNLINTLVSRADVREYLELTNELMIRHRCIDGFGINYSRDKILSVKFCLKIFDTQPKFSNKFLDKFLINNEFRKEFTRLCIRNNTQVEHRNKGLTGVNTSLKIHIEGGTVTRSVYRRTGQGLSEAISLSEGVVSSESYRYIFNQALQFLIKYYHNINIPMCAGGMEYYKRGEGLSKTGELTQTACITAYPTMNKKMNPKQYLKQYFDRLQAKDPWEIEGNILEAVSIFNKYIIPVTKGYQKNDLTRKIYLSCLSHKHSSIKALSNKF